jgi:hypothetical protein
VIGQEQLPREWINVWETMLGLKNVFIAAQHAEEHVEAMVGSGVNEGRLSQHVR